MTNGQPSLQAYDEPADRIRLHRQVYPGPVVVVEGPTDKRVLSKHLVGVEFFIAGTRSAVLQCAQRLADMGLSGYQCVYDRDFDLQRHPSNLDANCWPYIGRDLEAMLVDLGAFEDVVTELGSESKLEAMGGASALVAQATQTVAPLTRLRLKNAAGGYGLPFDKVDLARKINLSTLEFNLVGFSMALASEIEERLTTGEILTHAEVDDSTEPLPAPRGRDVLCVTGVALRRIAGSLKLHASSEAMICAQLHTAGALHLDRSEWLNELRSRLALA